ncbi:hypothetical protein ACFVT1_18125 [Streptomyces sp. NPDC057963]|uniref:hypothetical protein n=1 Tax=Streptomyces sp. NPDC057963 TaxID=3346290 RepID=UPI0036E78486
MLSSLSSSITQTSDAGKPVRSRVTVVATTASSSRHGTKKCQSNRDASPGTTGDRRTYARRAPAQWTRKPSSRTKG